MSTTVLRYIPEDPTHVPDGDGANVSRDLLSKATGKTARANVTDEVQFVDQGGNFDGLKCPACGSDLDMEWWQERMAAAREGSFADLGVTVPCCGAETSLHDLDYDTPAGFARFVLEVDDAEAVEDKVDLEALERVVGCLMRRIVARY
jgi:hypothetical protein